MYVLIHSPHPHPSNTNTSPIRHTPLFKNCHVALLENRIKPLHNLIEQIKKKMNLKERSRRKIAQFTMGNYSFTQYLHPPTHHATPLAPTRKK